MNRPLATMLAAGALLGAALSSRAQVVPYASYSVQTTDQYVFTNNGLIPGSGTFTGSNIPILFNFIPGTPIYDCVVLGGGPLGAVLAHINIGSSTSGTGTSAGGTVRQPLGATTFTITEDATGNVLLSATSISSLLSGDMGDVVGSLRASDLGGASIRLSSFYCPDIEDIAPTSTYSFGTSDFSPSFFLAPNGIQQSAAGTFNGNFSAVGGFTVPEPGPMAMLLGSGLSGSMVFLRRRRRK